jgi:hypothetical protein
VYIFDPSMPTSQIQATVDAIANQRVCHPDGLLQRAIIREWRLHRRFRV